MDQSSLPFFHKIHCGAVSIDKYMTPAHSLKTTRSSHSAHYRRHDALKNSFSLELFHTGIVCLLLWPMSSSQRSLGHSLFKHKFSQSFFVLFYQNFKICTPGVMLKSERSQYYILNYKRNQSVTSQGNCYDIKRVRKEEGKFY